MGTRVYPSDCNFFSVLSPPTRPKNAFVGSVGLEIDFLLKRGAPEKKNGAHLVLRFGILKGGLML